VLGASSTLSLQFGSRLLESVGSTHLPVDRTSFSSSGVMYMGAHVTT
jgi:hypothetical protein